MKRMAFRESDIPALDFIIDKTLESDWRVYSNELTEAGFLNETDPDLENKFESLLAIIDSYGCAKVNPARNADNGANAEKNGMTAKFKTDGGFRKAFKDQKREKLKKLIKQISIIVGIITAIIIAIVNITKCQRQSDTEELKKKYNPKSSMEQSPKEKLPLSDSLNAKKTKPSADTLLIDSLNI